MIISWLVATDDMIAVRDLIPFYLFGDNLYFDANFSRNR